MPSIHPAKFLRTFSSSTCISRHRWSKAASTNTSASSQREQSESSSCPSSRSGQELWNHEGTRLTLLFDPARVKRELVPNKENGRALVPGESYILEVSKRWRDAEGTPLAQAFSHRFQVGAADYESPDPKRWRVTPPPAGSRAALVVDASAPLDHALFQRLLFVIDPHDAEIAGTVTIDDRATRWSFVPEEPWSAQTYKHHRSCRTRRCRREPNRSAVRSRHRSPAPPGPARALRPSVHSGPIVTRLNVVNEYAAHKSTP